MIFAQFFSRNQDRSEKMEQQRLFSVVLGETARIREDIRRRARLNAPPATGFLLQP